MESAAELTIPDFFSAASHDNIITYPPQITLSPKFNTGISSSSNNNSVTWTDEEVQRLHRLMKVFDTESDKVTRYAKIAYEFHNKSIRDVVFKITALNDKNKKNNVPTHSASNKRTKKRKFREKQRAYGESLKSFEEKEAEAVRQLALGNQIIKEIIISECKSLKPAVTKFQECYVSIRALMELMMATPPLPVEPDFSILSRKRKK